MNNECPLCAAGIPTTQHRVIPLRDPVTRTPTGQYWRVSKATYDKIMALAMTSK